MKTENKTHVICKHVPEAGICCVCSDCEGHPIEDTDPHCEYIRRIGGKCTHSQPQPNHLPNQFCGPECNGTYCEQCKLVDELSPSMSYCSKHDYPKQSTDKKDCKTCIKGCNINEEHKCPSECQIIQQPTEDWAEKFYKEFEVFLDPLRSPQEIKFFIKSLLAKTREEAKIEVYKSEALKQVIVTEKEDTKQKILELIERMYNHNEMLENEGQKHTEGFEKALSDIKAKLKDF